LAGLEDCDDIDDDDESDRKYKIAQESIAGNGLSSDSSADDLAADIKEVFSNDKHQSPALEFEQIHRNHFQ
jgi:hypothetical protein